MAPKRLISGDNKESGETASVSEPQNSINGFTGITQGEKLQRLFVDGDWSSCDLPPPHPSPLLY
ncbi:hypothetical protein E2C01_040869 [Portunus trituberculatus]|uniref:Uncharacterized protein n=1 Tax=Portunus trituberculatus TaxID=210409 RepID=A0A5B7FRY7_PORTR|nr:hypothetical protein [Portunus trituberculatus]